MRVMALDVGERRVGVALSDPTGQLATPLVVVERRGNRADARALLDLAGEHGAERIVIGLPRRADGTVGPQAERVLALGRAIEKRTSLPVAYLDERLTTVEAEQRLLAAGVSREERRQRIDMVAAAVILEEYLSSLENRRDAPER